MNFKFSIFGIPSTGHLTRYPVWGDADPLKKGAERTKCSLLLIDRAERIMTYTYFQRLEKDELVGIRISVNDMEFTKPKALMGFLSHIISILNSDGKIVRTKTTPKVKIVFDENALLSNEGYFSHIVSLVGHAFEHSPLRFGIEKLHGNPTSRIPEELSYSDSNSQIIARTYQTTHVIIINKDPFPPSYLYDIITSLDSSLKSARVNIDNLKAENTRLSRTKKQFKTVLILFGILICAGAGLYMLKGDLDNTKLNLESTSANLDDAKKTITKLNKDISNKNSIISDQRAKLNNARNIVSGMSQSMSLPSWYSSNHTHGSRSYRTYDLYCDEGDEIVFDYYVDSETYDHLCYDVSGAVSTEGEFSGDDESGTVRIPVYSQGQVTLTVSYEKDGSVNKNSDRGYITNVHVNKGKVSELQSLGL